MGLLQLSGNSLNYFLTHGGVFARTGSERDAGYRGYQGVDHRLCEREAVKYMKSHGRRIFPTDQRDISTNTTRVPTTITASPVAATVGESRPRHVEVHGWLGTDGATNSGFSSFEHARA